MLVFFLVVVVFVVFQKKKKKSLKEERKTIGCFSYVLSTKKGNARLPEVQEALTSSTRDVREVHSRHTSLVPSFLGLASIRCRVYDSMSRIASMIFGGAVRSRTYPLATHEAACVQLVYRA